MKDFRPCFGALMRDLRPILWKLLVSVSIGLLDVVAALAFVWISKRVVDIATGQVEASLVDNAMLMAGIIVVQVICRVAIKYWEGYVLVDFQNSYRAGMFDKVMHSGWDGRDKFHSGDIMNRLELDINQVSEFVVVNIPECLSTVIKLVAATVFLFELSPKMSLYLIFIMPVAVIGSRLFFKKMRALTMEIRSRESTVQEHIQENVQHRVLVRTMGATSWVQAKLYDLQAEIKTLTVTRLNYSAVSRGFMNAGFSIGYLLVFLWGVFGIKSGTVTYGMMVAFLQLVGQVQRPVAEIAGHIPAFIRTLSSEERLMELSETPQDADSQEIHLKGAPGIRIENLTFAYTGQTAAVLSDFSHDFKPGSMTVIRGHTGIGKSTLIRLILSVLKPYSGNISLYSEDGITVTSGPATLCNFMYVPQGNSLMSGTIRQNLLLSKPDADEDQMRAALHDAVADFVLDLPQGLDTPCSEVGRGLSEGQAQRIAVARALLRDGGIMILDEASSALDEETETEMLSRISKNYRGTKTILCITHRPAATSFADQVLSL